MASIQRRDSYICHRRLFISFSFLSSSIQFSDQLQIVFNPSSFPLSFSLFSSHFLFRPCSYCFRYIFTPVLFCSPITFFSFSDFTITVSSRNQITRIESHSGFFAIFKILFRKNYFPVFRYISFVSPAAKEKIHEAFNGEYH